MSMIDTGDESLESEAVENQQTEDLTDPRPMTKMRHPDHVEALKMYHRGWDKERENIEKAYQDLNFAAGYQWLAELENQRLQDSRPVLTFNRMGQFIRQITGDIRQMKPAIEVVPVSDGANQEIADIRGGLIRHIENASDASLYIYTEGADSQVTAGIGHWEVASEYCSETTFEQELVIRSLDDQIAVIWDADARRPTRSDANHCFVPTDMTMEAYKDTYPGHAVEDMGTDEGSYTFTDNWYDADRVRVCRMWYKVKFNRNLLRFPDGTTQLADEMSPEELAQATQQGAQPYEREGYKVFWRMLNGTEFLTEPQEWKGRNIPIVPVLGEEIKIGSRIERHGIVRFAADAQRAYNYSRSTQTEFVGLQPKSPYLGTEDNFKDYSEDWDTANVKNWPYLRYKPDATNGGRAPERSQPPTTSPGLTECVSDAANDMQAIIGIYNASLGAKSNEDSGIAIQQREAQGDTGTYVYMANFTLAIKRTGEILNDLIPYYYDTARTIRIMGVDGKSSTVAINQPNPIPGEPDVTQNMLNDITVGTYDVQVEMGPSYATKREAAKDGMIDFIKAFPPAAPVMGDLIADAQDWPNSKKVSERLQTLLPPPIQQQIAQDEGKPPPPPQPPSPQEQAEQAKSAATVAESHAKISTSQIDAQIKQLQLKEQELKVAAAYVDLEAAQAKAAAAGPPINLKELKDYMTKTDAALQFVSEHLGAQISAEAPEEDTPLQQQGNSSTTQQ